MTYTEQQFNLPEMPGLSAKQIDVHLKLYAGYVKNVNALTPDVAPYRLAFEFNGMRLHELYFEALGGDGVMVEGTLKSAVEKQYGSFDAWLTEFKNIAMTRGIGWALLTFDAKPARSTMSGYATTKLATWATYASSLLSTSGSTHSWSTTSPRSASTTLPPSSKTSSGTSSKDDL